MCLKLVWEQKIGLCPTRLLWNLSYTILSYHMPDRILNAHYYHVRVRKSSLLVVDKRDIDYYCTIDHSHCLTPTV